MTESKINLEKLDSEFKKYGLITVDEIIGEWWFEITNIKLAIKVGKTTNGLYRSITNYKIKVKSNQIQFNGVCLRDNIESAVKDLLLEFFGYWTNYKQEQLELESNEFWR